MLSREKWPQATVLPRSSYWEEKIPGVQVLSFGEEARQRLRANLDDASAYEVFACVYAQFRRVTAELLLVSEGTVKDRLAWFNGDDETRREIADGILLTGGLWTFDDKWAEVARDG